MFEFLKNKKKKLDITDALVRKSAKITIGGKSVVIKAFTLVKALQLLEALSITGELLKVAFTDFASFNKYLVTKLPIILEFCEIDIKPEEITLTEFCDLIMAVYQINDLERIISNFWTAIQSMPKATQASAELPKR